MNLSIIIVSYNVRELLVNCLSSIFSNVGVLQVEVIVVDSASSDGTVEEIQSQFPSVQIISNSQNVGFPQANNQAFSIVSGDVILLLNPDTIVHQCVLTNLVHCFQQQPEARIVGLNVRNPDGTRQNSAHPLPSGKDFLFLATGFSDLFGGCGYFDYDYLADRELNNVTQVGWVSGAALAFNRTVLNSLDGLDEDLFWAEDLDFCYRANQMGIFVYFLPDAVITHYVGKSGTKNMARMIFHQHVSKIKFSRKHYGMFPSMVLEGILFVQIVIKVLMRAIQWLTFPKRSEYHNRILGYIGVLKYILNYRAPEARLG